MADLCVDWRKYGATVIAKVRSKNPTAYFRIVASICAQDLPMPVVGDVSQLTDSELLTKLKEAAAACEFLLQQEQG